jgi:ABC-2 type transport system permease protein
VRKIWLIIQREYLTRVRKKSFIIMTLLGPLLFLVMTIVPIWMADNAEREKVVEVLDQSHLFGHRLLNAPDITFAYFNGHLERAKLNYIKKNHEALLYIPPIDLKNPKGIILYSNNRVSPADKAYIQNIVSREIFNLRIENSEINIDTLIAYKQGVDITPKPIGEFYKDDTNEKAAIACSMFLAVLIFFFIFMYSGQVMRGIIEEKSNRILEIMISSVKPFQLMAGKIMGIGLVSLTQFGLWLSLTLAVSFFIKNKYEEKLMLFNNENIEHTLQYTSDVKQALEWNEIINIFSAIDFTLVISVFAVYFIGGYLLYSSLFAAIGSTSDNETDTQQFILPVIMPLFISIILLSTIIQEPDGSLAFWLSMLPLTSPVVMMVRIPFGVPYYEIILSMTILVISFLGSIWLAGRIYRVGILMYGKKINYREIGKWLFYKS